MRIWPTATSAGPTTRPWAACVAPANCRWSSVADRWCPTGWNGCAVKNSRPGSPTATAHDIWPPRRVPMPTSASNATTTPPQPNSCPTCRPSSPTRSPYATTPATAAGTARSPATPGSSPACNGTSTTSRIRRAAYSGLTRTRGPVKADAQDFLDQQIDGFGGAVADASGAEVGQELLAPGGDGARQPPEFGHPGVDARHSPVVEPGGGLVAIAAAVDRAQLLSGYPGRGDLAALIAGLDTGDQACPAGRGQVLGAAVQHPPNSVQRIPAAATVPVSLLLHPAAHVVEGGQSQPHDMKRIEHPHRLRQTHRQGQ